MKQQIEEIIKKNLPEEVHNNGNHFDIAETVGFNRCLSKINTSLIADEVLKVVVETLESLRERGFMNASYSNPASVYRQALDDIKLLLTNSSTLEGERSEHLSPNKENENNG